ncbi:hypothetical protein V5799_023255 [Amblyomma americanum]|uniref:Uncharacterized protein n=1 Tax=Amblyomma americanum TaxID=6943 RepID=A0AAQ4FIT3_AMBAM
MSPSPGPCECSPVIKLRQGCRRLFRPSRCDQVTTGHIPLPQSPLRCYRDDGVPCAAVVEPRTNVQLEPREYRNGSRRCQHWCCYAGLGSAVWIQPRQHLVPHLNTWHRIPAWFFPWRKAARHLQHAGGINRGNGPNLHHSSYDTPQRISAGGARHGISGGAERSCIRDWCKRVDHQDVAGEHHPRTRSVPPGLRSWRPPGSVHRQAVPVHSCHGQHDRSEHSRILFWIRGETIRLPWTAQCAQRYGSHEYHRRNPHRLRVWNCRRLLFHPHLIDDCSLFGGQSGLQARSGEDSRWKPCNSGGTS